MFSLYSESIVKFGNLNDLLLFKKRTSHFPIFSAHALRDAVGLKNSFVSRARYEEEKDALMRRLQGQDEQFMSERQRQAELARLKREKLKAKQEDKFSAAALVLGLAEKQKAAVEER